jgi:flagellar hook-basal body complex protein FliE
MAQVAAGMRDSLRTGEATALAGMQGKASAQQVVEAVMSAEQSLQTAIAIRDKVVSAYLEISRMAI